MYNITTLEYNQLKNIIYSLAKKNKYNADDFLSFSHEKLVNLATKYDPQKNDNFVNFAASQLRLYALNYRRDYLYPKSIPRKLLGFYVEFNNLLRRGWGEKAISHKIGVPLSQLKEEFTKLSYFSYENQTSLTSIDYQI